MQRANRLKAGLQRRHKHLDLTTTIPHQREAPVLNLHTFKTRCVSEGNKQLAPIPRLRSGLRVAGGNARCATSKSASEEFC